MLNDIDTFFFLQLNQNMTIDCHRFTQLLTLLKDNL